VAEKISDAKGKLFIQKIESRLALGKILNADQMKKLKQLGFHQKRKGPMQGGKHLSGPHSMEKSVDIKNPKIKL
jgi:hypothetical protein